MKKAQKWIIEEGIIYKKDLKTTMGGYNQKIKIRFSNQFRKIIQEGIYKELGAVVFQLQKNVRDNI